MCRFCFFRGTVFIVETSEARNAISLDALEKGKTKFCPFLLGFDGIFRYFVYERRVTRNSKRNVSLFPSTPSQSNLISEKISESKTDSNHPRLGNLFSRYLFNSLWKEERVLDAIIRKKTSFYCYRTTVLCLLLNYHLTRDSPMPVTGVRFSHDCFINQGFQNYKYDFIIGQDVMTPFHTYRTKLKLQNFHNTQFCVLVCLPLNLHSNSMNT